MFGKYRFRKQLIWVYVCLVYLRWRIDVCTIRQYYKISFFFTTKYSGYLVSFQEFSLGIICLTDGFWDNHFFLISKLMTEILVSFSGGRPDACPNCKPYTPYLIISGIVIFLILWHYRYKKTLFLLNRKDNYILK